MGVIQALSSTYSLERGKRDKKCAGFQISAVYHNYIRLYVIPDKTVIMVIYVKVKKKVVSVIQSHCHMLDKARILSTKPSHQLSIWFKVCDLTKNPTKSSDKKTIGESENFPSQKQTITNFKNIS